MPHFSVLGNDNIFALTNQKLYSVRFDLEDDEETKKYALYDNFWIDDESKKYTLHIAHYSGNAGTVIDICLLLLFYLFSSI